MQLWILQIKSDGSIESRIIYGRIVPHNFSNSAWSATDDDKFHDCGQFEAQVVQLNLYVKDTNCVEILKLLAAGESVAAISDQLTLNLKSQLRARFGTVALNTKQLAFRPAVYLLNRDSHERHSLCSPHGSAGAISAAITQTDKEALFRHGEAYNVALARLIVEHMNGHTGLDFGGADAQRFGDIELLVFPTLNDSEQSLLAVSWKDETLGLNVEFDPKQLPGFNGFMFRLSIETNGQITDSWICAAKLDADGIYHARFDLTEEQNGRIDSTEIEIFGLDDSETVQGPLCCRWRVGYIREIVFSGHAVGHHSRPVKFDWLEKTTPISSIERAKAALTLQTGTSSFESKIGGREADPWVPANRNLTSLFSRLHPAKSEGKFFLRLNEGDGNGRLEFVEWLKKLLKKYQNHQIVIFDPYFEDAGLGLLLLGASTTSKYIVFTSLPSPKTTDDTSNLASARIDNLIASGEQSRHISQHLDLRIFGLKDGRLHDRYILVIAPDGLAATGYHLSNSLQKANENYPLLITPIPSDILVDVEKYASRLVQQAQMPQTKGGVANPTFVTLFESKTVTPVPPPVYNPLRSLERQNAGDVFSVWTGENSLKGLSGDRLKDRMSDLGLIVDGKIAQTRTDGLRNCIDSQKGDFSSFNTVWEILGDVLAHSHYEDQDTESLKNNEGFLAFLANFVKGSFSRTLGDLNGEISTIASHIFQDPLKTILHSPYRLDHFVNFTKYAGLTWAEVFAIRFLWLFAPNRLRVVSEAEMAQLPIETTEENSIQLLLLSQIVGEIAQSVEFEASDAQRDCLLSSKNGLLRWLGLNSIEKMLEVENKRANALELITTFSLQDQIQALGWMIARAAIRHEKAGVYENLVAALDESLPEQIQMNDLNNLVDAVRGHMRSLGWAEPWLSRDIILPLLQNERASVDDASEIWIKELMDLLAAERDSSSRLFERSREGETTNLAAFLFAHSNSDRQHESLKSLKKVLKGPRRILQQPLASTSNWTKWHDSLVVSTWVLSFTYWALYYLNKRETKNIELENFSEESWSLAKARQWDQRQTGRMTVERQLTDFLEEARILLRESKESKTKTEGDADTLHTVRHD